MGILDNTSVNIFIDAVLTDLGRRYLARNDGSFEITKFALADDEINYGLIKKHGLIAGKAKIESNTQIFEALTNESVAQRYKLISINNQNLYKIPKIELTSTINGAGNNTSDVVNLNISISGQNIATLIVQQVLTDLEFDSELQDFNFEIEMNSGFLMIPNEDPISINSRTKAAKYILQRTNTDTANGSQIKFDIQAKSISNSEFQTYGNTQDKNTISTYIKVRGVNTGAEKSIKVNISKS